MLTKKRIFTGMAMAVLFIIAFGVTYLYRLYNRVVLPSTNLAGNTVRAEIAPTPTPDPLAPKNILLLGYGGAGHDGGSLTDTMILAHVEPKENKVTLVSIPRDIWVNLPTNDKGGEMFKINHAYTIGNDDENYPDKPDYYSGPSGGGLLVKEKVKEVTGLDIDYFVSVDFGGFMRIVELLGGVNVYVPYTFDDNYYPIKGEEDNTCGKSDEEMKALEATLSAQLLEKEYKCRYEILHFDSGPQTMDAQTALKFVRSRHSETNGGDFGRSLRQQQFLIGIKNELLNFGSITKLIPLLNTASRNVRTDINIGDATSLLLKQDGFTDVEIKTVSINTENVLTDTISNDGQYILVPRAGRQNWDFVHQYIQDNL